MRVLIVIVAMLTACNSDPPGTITADAMQDALDTICRRAAECQTTLLADPTNCVDGKFVGSARGMPNNAVCYAELFKTATCAQILGECACTSPCSEDCRRYSAAHRKCVLVTGNYYSPEG